MEGERKGLHGNKVSSFASGLMFSCSVCGATENRVARSRYSRDVRNAESGVSHPRCARSRGHLLAERTDIHLTKVSTKYFTLEVMHSTATCTLHLKHY